MALRPIFNRLPPRQSLLSVLAVIMFMVYTWTLYVYVQTLPYWLRFLNVPELISVLSYALLVDFLESFALFCLLAVICVILPSSFLKSVFDVRGAVFAISLLGAIMFYLNYPASTSWHLFQLIALSAGTLLVVILLSFVSAKIHFVVTAAKWLSENIIVFLYVYLPLTVIAFFVVLIRNL
jgi:hypothetical protein